MIIYIIQLLYVIFNILYMYNIVIITIKKFTCKIALYMIRIEIGILSWVKWIMACLVASHQRNAPSQWLPTFVCCSESSFIFVNKKTRHPSGTCVAAFSTSALWCESCDLLDEHSFENAGCLVDLLCKLLNCWVR